MTADLKKELWTLCCPIVSVLEEHTAFMCDTEMNLLYLLVPQCAFAYTKIFYVLRE